MLHTDDDVITSYDRVALDQVTIMKLTDFEPRGTTAPHDTIGQAILDLGRILEKTPEADRPGTAVFRQCETQTQKTKRHFNPQELGMPGRSDSRFTGSDGCPFTLKPESDDLKRACAMGRAVQRRASRFPRQTGVYDVSL